MEKLGKLVSKQPSRATIRLSKLVKILKKRAQMERKWRFGLTFFDESLWFIIQGKAIFENDKLTITTYPEIGEVRRELAFTGDKIEMV